MVDLAGIISGMAVYAIIYIIIKKAIKKFEMRNT